MSKVLFGTRRPLDAATLLLALEDARSMTRTEIWRFAGGRTTSAGLNALRDELLAQGRIDIWRTSGNGERWFYVPPQRTDGAKLEAHPVGPTQQLPEEESVQLENTDNTPVTATLAMPPEDADGQAKTRTYTPAPTVREFMEGQHMPPGFEPKVDVGLLEAQGRIRFDWVDPGDVRMDFENYARRPDVNRLRQYGAHFNLLLVGAVTLNERTDGTLFAIDGSHRCCDAVLTGVPLIPAIIYKHLDAEQEAWLAGHLNRDKKLLSPIEMFGMMLFGRDPVSMHIRDIVESQPVGGRDDQPGPRLKVASKGEGGSGATAIDAIDALKRMYDYDPSGALLKRTLQVVCQAWPGQKAGLRSPVLSATSIVLRSLPDKPRQERLIKQMAEIGHSELAKRVAYQAKGDTTAGWVEALLWAFNLRLAKKNQLALGTGRNIVPLVPATVAMTDDEADEGIAD